MRASTIRKKETLQQLKNLEYKFKKKGNYSTWDSQVKITFQNTGSYSFEDLVYNDITSAEYLVVKFKD
jgi:hypothetical protein